MPIPPTVRGKIIRPAIFLMQENGGDAAFAAKAIQLATDQYYAAMVFYLQSQEQTGDIATQILRSKHAAEVHSLPVWVENIIVVCRPIELTVAFYPRNGGWSVSKENKLVQANVLAFTCVVNSKTWKISGDQSSEGVSFRNLYENLSDTGIVTGYDNDPAFVTPLNTSDVAKPKHN
ncbi:MAG: hypothetical protein ABI273_09575 [Lacunisphaera sp.]